VNKETRSVVHDTSKEFDQILHEQLLEFAIILTKKYYHSFLTEFLEDYHRSFNKEEFLKMKQPKEKCNIRDDINGEWHYSKRICNE